MSDAFKKFASDHIPRHPESSIAFRAASLALLLDLTEKHSVERLRKNPCAASDRRSAGGEGFFSAMRPAEFAALFFAVFENDAAIERARCFPPFRISCGEAVPVAFRDDCPILGLFRETNVFHVQTNGLDTVRVSATVEHDGSRAVPGHDPFSVSFHAETVDSASEASALCRAPERIFICERL